MIGHPLALFGLIAALVPPVIYLLLRRRKTEIPWGASYLLRLTLTTKRKTSIWKQIVVLVLRSLAIALAALLIAGLLRRNPHPTRRVPAMPREAVHRIVLADNSLSMTVTEGATSRLTRLRDILDILATTQRAGDALTVIPLIAPRPTDAPVASFRGRLSRDERQGLGSTLAPREGPVGLEAPLATAFAHLATTPTAEAEIYILSDFPRELTPATQDLRWLREQARPAKLIPVCLASPTDTTPNIVIRGITTGTDTVLAGMPFSVYISAANLSDHPTEAVIEVAVDGQAAARASTPLKPEEEREIAVTAMLPQAGPALLEVRARNSRLPAYAARTLSLTASARLNVWLVADPPDAGRPDTHASARQFFSRAMASEAEGTATISVHEATMHEVTQPIPPDVDVIWIAGPRYSLPAAAEPLAAFVRHGGGVVFAMSDPMGHEMFNDSFNALAPALVGETWAEKTTPENFSIVRPELPAGACAVLRDLVTPRGGDLSEVRFYNLLRPQGEPLAGEILLRLTDGSPLLLHRGLGRGHIYQFMSSLDVEWCSLPVRQCYIPFLYKVSQAAMRGSDFPLNLATGDRLVLPWPTPQPVTWTTPEQNEQVIAVTTFNDRHFVTLPAVHGGGVHTLRDAAGHARHFTVERDATEADLRPLASDAQSRLASELGAPIYNGWPAAVRAIGGEDDWFAFAPWLLAAMLLVYVFESWFVRQL